MAYGDEQEQDFGMGGPGFGLGPDVRAGPDLAPGYGPDLVSSMADVLDEAASTIGGSGYQQFDEGAEDAPIGGSGYQQFDMGADPAAGTMGQGGVSMAGVTDLGSNPTLDQLQSAIDSVGQDTQAGVMPEGADAVTDLVGAEAGAVDEGTAGEQAATFLSDFQANRPASMSAGLNVTEETMSMEDQVSELRSQANELRTLAKGLLSVQKGYPNPNMNYGDYDAYSRSPAAWQNPNTAYTPLESPDYPAWQNPNTVRPPLESPNYPAWQNPNTVRPPLEGANFPPDWYNVNEQRAYPTAMGGNLPPISAQEAAATATGGGQGWVDPNASFEDLEAQFSTSPQVSPQVGGGAGWVNPNATFEELEAQFSTSPQQAATTLAPKYTGEGYQTHNQMYPNHRNFAAMAGVASIKAQFDGTHKAWISAINQDMKDRKIELTHEINGQKTGKHSSADWKEYAALFDPETGLDKNGVPMPGTDKQAQAGIGGVLQGLWGGALSGAQNLFKPKTSSGVEDPYVNLGYPPHASGNIPANIKQPVITGDAGHGDNPVDIIRSTYSWAASLPNNVLFNAARYPDYLRLLIEYDAAGKDLPLEVPKWILEGTARPAEDDEETPSYATQQQLSWATPAWMT
jgi:hypothetical protein